MKYGRKALTNDLTALGGALAFAGMLMAGWVLAVWI